MSNRFESTTQWMAAMARAGARDITFKLEVPPVEWVEWVRDYAVMIRYTVEPIGPGGIQFYGPSGLIMQVRVGAPR